MSFHLFCPGAAQPEMAVVQKWYCVVVLWAHIVHVSRNTQEGAGDASPSEMPSRLDAVGALKELLARRE